MRRVKLGDIEFDVIESENPNDSVEVTDKPVESGQDVSDHVKQNPSMLSIKGRMTENAAYKLQRLRQYQRDGVLLTYIGRNIYSNMVIVDLDREHGASNRLGFDFNITLKEVRIAVAKEVAIQVADYAAIQTKPVTNKGVQQPQEKKISNADLMRQFRELDKI